MEGRRKPKLGEVGLQICQKFLRKIEQKDFRPECPFNPYSYRTTGFALSSSSNIFRQALR